MPPDVYGPHSHGSHSHGLRGVPTTAVRPDPAESPVPALPVDASATGAAATETATTDAATIDAATTGDGRDDWQGRLRGRGYRLTPQRQLVLEAVAKLGHATPEAIVTEVRRTATAVNISTVYRTLDLLEDLGLVSHAHLTHGAPTYHVTGHDRHIHLVCGGCGAISELSPDRLAGLVDDLRRELGFTVNVDHVALAGRCADCSARGEG